MKAHPGFKAVAAGIAQREGIPAANANAILASKTRNASPAAKAKNPRLNRVKGKATTSAQRRRGIARIQAGLTSEERQLEATRGGGPKTARERFLERQRGVNPAKGD